MYFLFSFLYIVMLYFNFSLSHIIDKPILSFRRNAFFPLKEEKRLIAKKNSKEVITLLYHEVILTINHY